MASVRALRDLLAAAIDGTTSARDIASLAARLLDVLDLIESAERLSAPAVGTTLDVIARRRADRSAAVRARA